MEITYDEIISVIRDKLEPLDFVHAMFEGGSAAFGRWDEYSDIDLQLTVDDGRELEAFKLVEQAVEELTPFTHKLEMPQPTWHGYFQNFYKMRDTSDYLLLDLVIRNKSNPSMLQEVELHGTPKVHFDKGEWTKSTHLDQDNHRGMLKERLERNKTMFEMFLSMTTKDLNRGNHVGAIHFYHNMTLRTLTETLGIRYCPLRYNFSAHYAQYHMPEDVVVELTELHYIKDPDDLWAKLDRAKKLFADTFSAIDPDNIL